MTTLIPPHTLLNMTCEQFENDCMERYMRWTIFIAANYNKTTGKNIKFDCLLSNTALSNYYNVQFWELLHFFKVSGSKMHNHVSREIMRAHYCEVLTELYRNYPSALIEAAVALKIENQISLN